MRDTKGSGEDQQPWFEKHGVREYKKKVGEVSREDLEALRITPESILHVVRHLVSISPEARKRMQGMEIDNEATRQVVDDVFLDAQLKAAGSKFHESLTDPMPLIKLAQRKLLEALEAGEDMPWLENQKTGDCYAEVKITVNDEDKRSLGLELEERLGTCSVVKITPEMEGLVKQEQRGKGEAKDKALVINVVRGIEPPTTDDLVIVIKKEKTENEPVLRTIYTGIMTASLPYPPKLTPEELAYGTEWWKDYAFVK